jgi:hypothetical protein
MGRGESDTKVSVSTEEYTYILPGDVINPSIELMLDQYLK